MTSAGSFLGGVMRGLFGAPPAAQIPSPASRDEPEGYPVGLRGESFYQPAIRRCREGQSVTLLREIGNPHSKSGRTIAAVNAHGETIGYVASDSWLHRAVHEQGKGCDAVILSIGTGEDGKLGVVLDVGLTSGPLGERPFAR